MELRVEGNLSVHLAAVITCREVRPVWFSGSHFAGPPGCKLPVFRLAHLLVTESTAHSDSSAALRTERGGWGRGQRERERQTDRDREIDRQTQT